MIGFCLVAQFVAGSVEIPVNLRGVARFIRNPHKGWVILYNTVECVGLKMKLRDLSGGMASLATKPPILNASIQFIRRSWLPICVVERPLSQRYTITMSSM